MIDTPDVVDPPVPIPTTESVAVSWVSAAPGTVPPNAVLGGFDNENLFVGRAPLEGALIPGKVLLSHGVCYVPWGGAEHGIPEYEVGILYLNFVCFFYLESLMFSYVYLSVCCLTRSPKNLNLVYIYIFMIHIHIF